LSIYKDQDQFYDTIKLFGNADVFHVHNEPSYLVAMIKDVWPDKPVILDMHDSMVLRYPEGDNRRYKTDERYNIELADALVFVSEPMAKMVVDFYDIKKPYIVLPSYVPKRFYRCDAWKWLGGVVYEGGVTLSEQLPDKESFFSYSDYRDVAIQFHDMGIPFNLYAPTDELDDLKKAYGPTAVIHNPMAFDGLIQALGRHEWGLLGNLGKHPAWQAALPNKLFDYMAAGVPVIALNAEYAGEFVEEHHVGISVSSTGSMSLKNAWDSVWITILNL